MESMMNADSAVSESIFQKKQLLPQSFKEIVRRLLWKRTTTHSLRNNNPMFDDNLCPLLIDQPSMSSSFALNRTERAYTTLLFPTKRALFLPDRIISLCCHW